MRDNGRMISIMVKGDMNLRIIWWKGNMLMESLMDLHMNKRQMVLPTKETGKMINMTGKEFESLKMVPNMTESLSSEKNMVMVDF